MIVIILQIAKAKDHYDAKKQLLQENQEELAKLREEMKAIAMEKKMLQLDLDKAKTNEKRLNSTVASLEAQVGASFQSME